LSSNLKNRFFKKINNNFNLFFSLEEIQRSIEEMKGRNFFLALLGDRYGWTPSLEQVTDHLATK